MHYQETTEVGKLAESTKSAKLVLARKPTVRKMKEKCKDAARMRREKERAEFVELSKLLPLPSSTTSQLDKASIIRLTSSYLRMRSAFPEGLGKNWGSLTSASRKTEAEQHQHQQQSLACVGRNCAYLGEKPKLQQLQIRELASLILQTLDGFVFALHKDGKIMYISETASVHLGLPQIDLTGSSIFDFIHPDDKEGVCEALKLSQLDQIQLLGDLRRCNSRELARSFCMRMKCILPKRNAGLVTSGYKAIHCLGYLKVKRDQVGQHNQDNWSSYALVAVGHSLLPTASTEVKLTKYSFMFRANVDLRLNYLEAPLLRQLGFKQSELLGQSLYQLVHPADAKNLEQAHRSLIEKGQTVSKYLRLMKKSGGFIWIQCHATLISNPRNMPKLQHIVGVCFLLADDSADQCAILNTAVETSLDPTSPKNVNCKEGDSTCTLGYISSLSDPNGTICSEEESSHVSSNESNLSQIHTSSHKGAERFLQKQGEHQQRAKVFPKKRAKIEHSKPRANQIRAREISNGMRSSSSARLRMNESILADRQNQPSFACLASIVGSLGVSRRASDDSSSVVSSSTSTNVSSSSSNLSSVSFVNLTHQTSNYAQDQQGLQCDRLSTSIDGLLEIPDSRPGMISSLNQNDLIGQSQATTAYQAECSVMPPHDYPNLNLHCINQTYEEAQNRMSWSQHLYDKSARVYTSNRDDANLPARPGPANSYSNFKRPLVNHPTDWLSLSSPSHLQSISFEEQELSYRMPIKITNYSNYEQSSYANQPSYHHEANNQLSEPGSQLHHYYLDHVDYQSHIYENQEDLSHPVRSYNLYQYQSPFSAVDQTTEMSSF